MKAKHLQPQSNSGGERKYRVKIDSLKVLDQKCLDLKDGSSIEITQFEKHMIQEGVKQVIFAQGTEEFKRIDEHGSISEFYRVVPKEMIRFLLDYDVIEEYEY